MTLTTTWCNAQNASRSGKVFFTPLTIKMTSTIFNRRCESSCFFFHCRMVSCRENKMPIAMLKGSQTRHPNCTFLLRCADPTWQNIFKSWAFFESPSEILVGEIDPGYHLGSNPSATGILGVWIQLGFPILEEWHLRFLRLFKTYMFGGFSTAFFLESRFEHNSVFIMRGL